MRIKKLQCALLLLLQHAINMQLVLFSYLHFVLHCSLGFCLHLGLSVNSLLQNVITVLFSTKLYLSSFFVCTQKVKVKSLFTRLSSRLRPPGSMTSGSIVFLPLTSSSRIHLQRRHALCRCARPLLAKAGTIPSHQFCHQSRNFRKN
jgi:hypothetical protein